MKLGISVLVIISTIAIVEVVFAQVKKQVPKEVKKQDLEFNNETNLIIQHIKKGENDAAIELAKEYLISNPNNITIINVLTEAYINKGDLSAAEETAKKGIAIQPGNPWACRLLARIYRIKSEKDPSAKSNNLNLALEHEKVGLASNPNDVWLLAEAAQIYSEMGDKVEANRAIGKALNISANETYLKTIKEMINNPIKETIKK